MRPSREVADGRTERDAMCEIFLTTARSSHCAPTERRLLVSGKFISERLARSNESAAEISIHSAKGTSFEFSIPIAHAKRSPCGAEERFMGAEKPMAEIRCKFQGKECVSSQVSVATRVEARSVGY